MNSQGTVLKANSPLPPKKKNLKRGQMNLDKKFSVQYKEDRFVIYLFLFNSTIPIVSEHYASDKVERSL